MTALHRLLACIVGVTAWQSAAAQSLLKTSVQHATVESAVSAPTVSPGGTVTLWVDVTPDKSVHIYADGAKDVTAAALLVTPHAMVSTAKARFPKPEQVPDPVSLAPVPAYARAFRISVAAVAAASAKPGDTVTIGGVLTYQACDDRVCYPTSSAPVTWRLQVR